MNADTISPRAFKSDTGKFWAITPWMSRVFLAVPILIFTAVGLRYVASPSHAVAAMGVVLSTPEAITDTRTTAGFVLTLVVVLVYCLLSQSRLRLGHALLVVSLGLILALRFFGFAHDGTTLAMGDQMKKTAGEVLFLVLNSVGLVLQSLRLRD